MGLGVFAAPGMSTPVRPASTGRFAAPYSSAAYCQKFVLPAEVVLIEPAGSATASYVTVIRSTTSRGFRTGRSPARGSCCTGADREDRVVGIHAVHARLFQPITLYPAAAAMRS